MCLSISSKNEALSRLGANVHGIARRTHQCVREIHLRRCILEENLHRPLGLSAAIVFAVTEVGRHSCSTRTMILPAETPMARHSRRSVSTVGDFKLRSSWLIYDRSTFAAEDKASCVIPAPCRAACSSSPSDMEGNYCLAWAIFRRL